MQTRPLSIQCLSRKPGWNSHPSGKPCRRRAQHTDKRPPVLGFCRSCIEQAERPQFSPNMTRDTSHASNAPGRRVARSHGIEQNPMEVMMSPDCPVRRGRLAFRRPIHHHGVIKVHLRNLSFVPGSRGEPAGPFGRERGPLSTPSERHAEEEFSGAWRFGSR